jgi:hypothetical protein
VSSRVSSMIASVSNTRFAIGSTRYSLYRAALCTNNYKPNASFLLCVAASCGISGGYICAWALSSFLLYLSNISVAFLLAAIFILLFALTENVG